MLVHYFGIKENLIGLALVASRPDVPALLAHPDRAEFDAETPADEPLGAGQLAGLARLVWRDLADADELGSCRRVDRPTRRKPS
jgi:hypothetical protein